MEVAIKQLFQWNGWTPCHRIVGMIATLLGYQLPWQRPIFCFLTGYNIVRWDPEGRYHYSKMSHWEPEGCYHRRLCTAIAPFWFSTEHLWILKIKCFSGSQRNIFEYWKRPSGSTNDMEVAVTAIFYWNGALAINLTFHLKSHTSYLKANV